MRTQTIIKIEIAAKRGARLADAVVGAQIDLFVLHRFPQPLDKHVVVPCALAVHADLDVVFDQHAGEVFAGELAALVGVEDVGLAVFRQRLLQRLDAKVRTFCPSAGR